MSAPAEEPSEADAYGLIADPDLARITPSRLWHWLGAPLVLAGIAIAGIALVLQARSGIGLRGWLLLALAVATLMLAVALATTGYRAYALFTPAAARTFIRVQVIGTWILSTVVLMSGVVGGLRFFVELGLVSAVTIFRFGSTRSTFMAHEISRVARGLRPLLWAEAAFVVVAPPIAALVVVQVSTLPTARVSEYVADAIILPTIGLLALVVLLWHRARVARARVARQ